MWVNGEVIARTKAAGGSSDGHDQVDTLIEPPFVGGRPTGYGDREAFGEVVIGADGKCRVVFETIVGGKKLRAETGELCVAVQTMDGKSFTVLAASGAPAPLTDKAIEAQPDRIEAALISCDDTTRRAEAASQNAFWEKRHAIAREWVKAHPAPQVPRGAEHPIDAFLSEKIERAKAASAAAGGAAQKFHAEVLPILRDNCFRCQGEKEKGGLRLNSREAALKNGASGKAADNDAPLAAKGQILAGTFLGVELGCARCHDSPYHSTKQRDLYSLAAMMSRKPIAVPKSSTVPAAFFEKKRANH